jgi:1-deoxy-D-xylulose-5-phosphate reductoisomerase
MPAVLNGANEIAVQAFLDGRIGFTDIPALIEHVMEAHQVTSIPTVESVLAADRWARETAHRILARDLHSTGA